MALRFYGRKATELLAGICRSSQRETCVDCQRLATPTVILDNHKPETRAESHAGPGRPIGRTEPSAAPRVGRGPPLRGLNLAGIGFITLPGTWYPLALFVWFVRTTSLKPSCWGFFLGQRNINVLSKPQVPFWNELSLWNQSHVIPHSVEVTLPSWGPKSSEKLWVVESGVCLVRATTGPLTTCNRSLITY